MSYTEELWKKAEDAERFAEQSELLIKAAKRERQTGFFEFLRDMLGLGIKTVFSGVYDALAITLAAAAGIFIFTAQTGASVERGSFIYGLTFVISPVVYFIFFLLTVIKERQEGGYEVKMTCRYTALHLCAFRMFLSGIGCLLLNAAFTAVIACKTEAVYAELLAVSFSSLFLFALLLIVSLLRHGLKGTFIPAVMYALSALLCRFEECTRLMRAVPFAAYLILGGAAALLFCKTLINIDRRYSYAVR